MHRLAPALFAALYMAVVAISALPLISPNASKFAGVYLTITTWPWSAVFLFALEMVSPSLIDQPPVRTTMLVASALINAVVIYWFFARRSAGRKVGNNHGHDAA
jgi:hypothetical protein